MSLLRHRRHYHLTQPRRKGLKHPHRGVKGHHHLHHWPTRHARPGARHKVAARHAVAHHPVSHRGRPHRHPAGHHGHRKAATHHHGRQARVVRTRQYKVTRHPRASMTRQVRLLKLRPHRRPQLLHRKKIRHARKFRR
jgi:hypothetical protein